MDNKQRALNVLTAWHRIEFFQVYSLANKEDEELIPRDISFQELKKKGNCTLPWFNLSNLQQFGLDSQKETKYTLNLGLFEKAALVKIVNQKMPSSVSEMTEQEVVEIEQRLDSEGESCFAQLKLDEHGNVDIDSFTISTLPWALGCLLNGELEKITHGQFRQSCQALKEEMVRILAVNGTTVTAEKICQLVELLYDWARVNYQDLLLIKEAEVPCFRLSYFQFERKDNKKSTKDKSIQDSDESEEADDSAIPILNSFYVQDIEKAINCINKGTVGKGLMRYLSKPERREIDLYSDEALSLIAQHLSPENTPSGRWPSPPQYNMSLMQQFAINTVFKELTNEGLLSVNGPPGTGKTTLLRDVIAQNIVERAKVLAALTYADEGLDKDGFLIESLTGFEMVVASSNNAAVENISRELPQNDSIDDDYLSDCCYFKPIANQLAAGKRKDKLQPIHDAQQQCWGLISAAMGAKAKRDEFSQRFFFDKYFGDNIPQERPESENFLNLWKHFKHVPSMSFVSAKDKFLQALHTFEEEKDRQIYFVTLGEELRLCEQQLAKLHEVGEAYEGDLRKLEVQIQSNETQLILLSDKLNANEARLEALRLQPPGFFSRLFNTKTNKCYKVQKANILKCSASLLERCSEERSSLTELKEKQSNLMKHHHFYQQKVENKQKERTAKTIELQHLKNNFNINIAPRLDVSINDVKLQQNAYWQETSINDKRSKVFIAAMNLHEAWLYEAKANRAFMKHLFELGDCLKATKEGLNDQKLWQIMFMFVPVLSSTFASLGRMFSKLDEKSLGWLMIDEAGQAIPQAAVGGLLRAKRTIVVGDPLQIEPVFTSPPSLVDHLMELSLGDEKDQWTPEKWSVQELADRVNPYGCSLTVQGEAKWIGIPLWVHRRCINPMFAISNKVAYQDRMIHGNYESNRDVSIISHPQLGSNCWVEAVGECSYKQFYPNIGEKTLAILTELVGNGGELKDVYVISPFKAVKNELKKYIQKHSASLRSAKGFNSFLKNNIGTVHTFQGKESHTVILTLGCDRDKQGGAVWASSKPNLLNVAVTRAKKNLFVVGNSKVWADKLYFSDCFDSLKSEQQSQQMKAVISIKESA